MLIIQYTDKYEIFYKNKLIGCFKSEDDSAVNLLTKAINAIKITKSVSKLSLN